MQLTEYGISHQLSGRPLTANINHAHPSATWPWSGSTIHIWLLRILCKKKESDSYLISLQVNLLQHVWLPRTFFVQSLVKSQFLSTCLAAPKLYRAIIVHHLWTSTVCSSGLGVWPTTSYDLRNLQISIISAAEMKHVSDAQCTLVFYRLSAGFPYRVSFGLHDYVSSPHEYIYISSLYPW